MKAMPPLLIYMALSGALLAFATLAIRKIKPFKKAKEGSWIAQVQAGGNRVPYGIPIAFGAFVAFFVFVGNS
jgi:Flp pilus assembly protein protease CpaA